MRSVRLRLLGLLALVGVLALAGCTHSPSQALRVGDVSVDNAQVEATAEPFAQALTSNASGVTDPVAKVRQSVVQLTIFKEVARRYAQEKGVTPAAPDYAGVAQSLGVGEDDPYARLNAEAGAYLTALRDNATARTPTDAEIQDVYDRYLVLAGSGAATQDEVRQQLLALPEYGQSLALRDALTDAIARYGVTVNPRYQPLQFPLLVVANGQLTLVSLPLGDQGTGAVRSAS
jgi:hypothetical protein